jgi:nucleotide-binding universal stress UspA family protein
MRLILLHVIPMPYVTSPAIGIYTGQLQPVSATLEQRQEAEKILATVRTLIQEQSLSSPYITICLRMGTPAEEIIKVAREVNADLVIIGSRGSTFKQRLRRFFMGSKSRSVLQSAPCPVMIVNQPQINYPTDLVSWYQVAITQALQNNPDNLSVFTPEEVVQLFAPPGTRPKYARKEHTAAHQALENLTQNGVLCRHDIKGELRYIND